MPFDSQVGIGETGETGETEYGGLGVTGEIEEFCEEFLVETVETVETVELETITESGNVEESRSQSFSSEKRSLQGRQKRRQKLEGNRNGSLQPGKIRLQTQDFPRGNDSTENSEPIRTEPR